MHQYSNKNWVYGVCQICVLDIFNAYMDNFENCLKREKREAKRGCTMHQILERQIPFLGAKHWFICAQAMRWHREDKYA